VFADRTFDSREGIMFAHTVAKITCAWN